VPSQTHFIVLQIRSPSTPHSMLEFKHQRYSRVQNQKS